MTDNNYKKIIRAVFTDDTVRVYQAFNSKIADNAILHQKFTLESGWSDNRTTWIKPSFCWVLYRSGYGFKHNQERILAIDIKREAFEWILENHIDAHETGKSAIPSSKKKIVVQWDPERNISISKLDGCGDIRSIQIGVKKSKIKEYNEQWIQAITDVTPIAHQIKKELDKGDLEKAKSLLPDELLYTPKNVRF
ncbi:hypothetical protein ACTFIU_005780 [Dictyostelium citrinum]